MARRNVARNHGNGMIKNETEKLKLKNFGPFINETVDFSRLTEAPLLISGKTGAGKTTILMGSLSHFW